MKENSPHNCIVCGEVPLREEKNDIPMFHCPACDLLWRKTFDIEITHYAEQEPDYSESKIVMRQRNTRHRLEMMKAYMVVDEICDVGTGEGMFLQILREAGCKKFFGIEPGKSAFSFGLEKNLPILRGTIENLPSLAKTHGPIRIFTLFHVIEHLPEPQKVLRTLFSLLPPKGFIVLETPTTNGYSLRRTKFRHKLVYPEHFFYFNEYNFSKLLDKVGFKVISVQRRDFDQKHMSIAECLFRLGVISKRMSFFSRGLGYACRKLRLRLLLNWLVIYFNRLDYMLVIAQK